MICDWWISICFVYISQPRSQSSSAISDETSPVKLVWKIRRGLSPRFQASSGNWDSANWPGYEAVYFCDSRSLLVIGIMIDGSEKLNCEGGF